MCYNTLGSTYDCEVAEKPKPSKLPEGRNIGSNRKDKVMAKQRKTSAPMAKLASKTLKSPGSPKPTKKLAGSVLSQRAPKMRKK